MSLPIEKVREQDVNHLAALFNRKALQGDEFIKHVELLLERHHETGWEQGFSVGIGIAIGLTFVAVIIKWVL